MHQINRFDLLGIVESHSEDAWVIESFLIRLIIVVIILGIVGQVTWL